MKKFSIILAGVGGQGILTLGSIIGSACTIAGLDVAIAEVHGMSQRGGSVVVHVRIGREPSPISPVGSSDMLIALELIEAARYLHYLREGGTAVVNDFLWPPPLSKYPPREALVSAVKSRSVKLYLFDANNASLKYTGSAISSNVAMLGYALGVSKELRELLPPSVVVKALEEHFSGKVLEANVKLFQASFEEGLKHGGSS
ncbi:MAG: indolepyruvate oxidoreductase subunit beta [Desulfurococcaceae archaeon]